ncbi:MAG: NHL repeat-containing protein, partial [Treponema sp.]|nr:NHL repeat-containing protein [Treponema sp.]
MKKILTAFVFCISFFSLVAQSKQVAGEESVTESRPIRTAEEGLRDEEFRRGVQSFYRGAFNDAVLRFEKALSYLPNDSRVLDWLGKSYYRSGMEGFALELWQTASANGYGDSLLQDRIEIIRERRITGVDQETQLDYTEAGSFPGINGKNMIFNQPVSVLPNPNGTTWLLSYGSNDLLLFDINGLAINRITGPINGFDRPVDIIRLHDGNLLVSESAGDRLSLFTDKGHFVKYIGSKGRKLGEMLGPQYLAQDSYSNIYVTDFGNSRVDVFDSEGKPLLFFGGKTESFDGLLGPTGIAIYQDRIFVSDCIRGGVYEFDRAGNYVGVLVEAGIFKHPEALKLWDEWLL